LGGVVAYDMPEYGSFMKFKLLKTVLTHNAPDTYAATIIWGKKFQASSSALHCLNRSDCLAQIASRSRELRSFLNN